MRLSSLVLTTASATTMLAALPQAALAGAPTFDASHGATFRIECIDNFDIDIEIAEAGSVPAQGSGEISPPGYSIFISGSP